MRIDQTYVALDLELTGLDPSTDAIIEVAAVKFRAGEVVDTWGTLVNPRRPIPHKITRLTGIKQSDLQRAPSLAEVAGKLIGFVRDFPLVGHSVGHDVDCLAREGVRLSNPVIDTFELTNVLVPHLSGRGLESIARELGFDAGQHHRAAADAAVSKDLFCYLIDRALDLDIGVVQEINRVAATADWPLRGVFQAVEREQARTAFSGGSSLRQLLAAKQGLEEASLDNVLLLGDTVEPLEPLKIKRPIDVDGLAEMLGPEGAFAGLPGYEHRPQQAKMLRAVGRAFNEGQTLLVEAGTGTGKSAAYLLPAAKFAVENNEHVVISTKTINLQDQLFHKDIPDLQRLLPFEFKAALLKGRSNYVCLRRYGTERRRQGLTSDEAGALIKVLAWLPTTKTGDWSEMSLTPGEKAIWPRLAADGEHCLGPKCQFFRKRTCFLYRARWEAAAAHVVVVNHALLLSEVGTEGGTVLPEYRYLVIDEAHNLEDVATDQLSHTVGRREIEAMLDDLSRESVAGGRVGLLNDVRAAVRAPSFPAGARQEIEATVERAHDHVDGAREACRRFAEILGGFLGGHGADSGEYSRRLRITRGVRAQNAWVEVENAWEGLSLRLVDVENDLKKLSVLLVAVMEDGLADGERLVLDVDGATQKSDEMRRIGGDIVGKADSAYVQWAEDAGQYRRGEASLRAAPLEVGELLQRELFDQRESVVLTSATLSIAGSCDYVAGRLGLCGAPSLLLDSPFDYKESTLIYMPQDIPEPNQAGHQKAVERAIVDLCRATQGRTLVLFTSHSQLATTFHAIRRPLQQDEILVLAQRVEGSSRRQLLRTFRSNPRTVLLGSASFWEGVDVVGDALSVLVIAKLPFAVPTDPVFAARSETFEDPFTQYSLPQTVLKFKQGFGRLIRSKSDRGVVVILDRRLQTKTYGHAFLRSLPGCTLRKGSTDDLPSAAASWLDESSTSH